MTARAEKRHAQEARRGYLADHPWCEVQSRTCTGAASQVHHRQRLSQGGLDIAENFLATCLTCHDLIHREPALAYRNGWLVHSWEPVS